METVKKCANEMKKKRNLGTNSEDICETIGIMDRVYNILTDGLRLRKTQVLALLLFFHEKESRGLLCQIQTGEGKTIIISMLAAIRAVQGFAVDVITRNKVLPA